MQPTPHRVASHPAVRAVSVLLAVAFCLWTIQAAATFGLSRLFARYAIGMGDPSAGKRAVGLTPTDPESYLANAEALSITGNHSEAIRELERAVALRPADYSLWLGLGVLRDQLGDPTAALAALDEAVKRAPFYSQPRWQRGNLLLRTGQYDAAFKDLNQAARSEPELIPNLIDLAWTVAKSDQKLTEQLAEINTTQMRIAFARLLARQGKGPETILQVRAIGSMPSDIRRELVEQLLAKNAIKEAFEIWRGDAPKETASSIDDGGFEAPLTFDQGGFGWRVTRTLPAIALAVDSDRAQSGAKSLRIEFSGDSSIGSPFVSQLILVEPSSRYRVSFAARSEDIVSGAVPMVVVRAATGTAAQLAHSEPLSRGSRDWQLLSFEFDVPADTTAVFVGVQRESCATAPCPAFGRIWLDSFSVEQLKSVK